MASMHYLLQPRAPLVFGTGRPLEFGIGGETLAFPFPTSVAGALRAAHEAANDRPANAFADNGLRLNHLALARFDWLDPDSAPELLLPRPADVVYLGGRMHRLRPAAVPSDCWTDLPTGLQMLQVAGDADDLKGKPDAAPPWWTAAQFDSWLADPNGACASAEPFNLKSDTRPDTRTHVVMDPLGKGAVDGGLFRTTGRDFGPARGGSLGHALAVSTLSAPSPAPNPNSAGVGVSLHGQARRLGGEGRFVRIESLADDQFRLPKRPDQLDRATSLRFVLTTPAVFPNHGWYPDWLAAQGGPAGSTPTITGRFQVDDCEVKVVLTAAAISRAQSWSGWTQSTGHPQGAPGKPFRVVPAGSVYWFDVAPGDAPKLWRRSLCNEPWAADGWGYGLVGLA